MTESKNTIRMKITWRKREYWQQFISTGLVGSLSRRDTTGQKTSDYGRGYMIPIKEFLALCPPEDYDKLKAALALDGDKQDGDVFIEHASKKV